jgi:hypothetical protein
MLSNVGQGPVPENTGNQEDSFFLPLVGNTLVKRGARRAGPIHLRRGCAWGINLSRGPLARFTHR